MCELKICIMKLATIMPQFCLKSGTNVISFVSQPDFTLQAAHPESTSSFCHLLAILHNTRFGFKNELRRCAVTVYADLFYRELIPQAGRLLESLSE